MNKMQTSKRKPTAKPSKVSVPRGLFIGHNDMRKNNGLPPDTRMEDIEPGVIVLVKFGNVRNLCLVLSLLGWAEKRLQLSVKRLTDGAVHTVLHTQIVDLTATATTVAFKLEEIYDTDDSDEMPELKMKRRPEPIDSGLVRIAQRLNEIKDELNILNQDHGPAFTRMWKGLDTESCTLEFAQAMVDINPTYMKALIELGALAEMASTHRDMIGDESDDDDGEEEDEDSYANICRKKISDLFRYYSYGNFNRPQVVEATHSAITAYLYQINDIDEGFNSSKVTWFKNYVAQAFKSFSEKGWKDNSQREKIIAECVNLMLVRINEIDVFGTEDMVEDYTSSI